MKRSHGEGWSAAGWQTVSSRGLRRALQRLLFATLVVISVSQGVRLSWPADIPAQKSDLASFVESGRRALSGANPYICDGCPANLNPPVSLVLFAPLVALDSEALPWFWYGASLALYGLATLVLAWIYPEHQPLYRASWALGLAAPWHALAQGNLYVVLLVLVVGAWLLLRAGRTAAAGALIGLLVALKPSFLIWPVLLWLVGARRAAVGAVVTGGTLSLLPLLVFDPAVYGQWLALAQAVSLSTSSLPGNAGLLPLVARLGLPWLGVALVLALGAGVVAWTWRARPPVLDASAVGLACGLVLSPVLWAAYAMLLLPVLFHRRRWPWGLSLAVLLLSFPAVQVAWQLPGSDRGLPGLMLGIGYLLVLASVLSPHVRCAGDRRVV
jgi:hypothetical protein